MKRYAFFILSVMAFASVGFVAGFRQAWALSPAYGHILHGALATTELKLLKEGKTDRVAESLEASVDFGLMYGYDVCNSHLRPLLDVLAGQDVNSELDKVAEVLAEHRKEVPSNVPGVQSDPHVAWMIQRYAQSK